MANKMTNVKAIGYVLENCVLPDEVFEKIKNIKASLEKKSTGKKKATKDDLERQEIKDTIFNFLSENEGSQYTITEIMHNIEGYNKYSNQKLSALVKQLIAEGLVEREEDGKGKAVFSLATNKVVEVDLETEEVAEDTETDFDNPAEDI
nr:MAG TPA: ferric uptake regulation protein [Caudoviricetes sp.]